MSEPVSGERTQQIRLIVEESMGTKDGSGRTRYVRPGGRLSVSQNGKHVGGRQHTVLSLFSGGGGLDLGLHLTARFRHLACLEHDRSACQTLEANRDAGLLGGADLKVFQADIAGLDPARVLGELGTAPGEVGLLVGGPPCQPFSVAGKKLGTADPRGRLLWDYVRWVKEVRPACFLMENVRGLLSLPSAPSEPKGSLLTRVVA